MTAKGRKISERMKAYWANRRAQNYQIETEIKKEMFEPVTIDRKKSLTINQTVSDVEMDVYAEKGRLETYTLRFQGGSKISFTVEE
jgi:hypothetical protein